MSREPSDARAVREAWRVKDRASQNFIDRRWVSAPPRRVLVSARDCLGLCLLGRVGAAASVGLFERIAGSGSEAASQAELQVKGFIACGWASGAAPRSERDVVVPPPAGAALEASFAPCVGPEAS